MRKLDARQVVREKSAFRYSSALECGDFSTVETILQEAERDTALAQMLAEINMVYEGELIRLSPPTSGLNHSTNHHRKDLLMTTITLPAPQRSTQRWLPFTLAAACLSVLFMAALLMRPTPDGGLLAGLQGQASETPSALPTIVPTLTATPLAATMELSTEMPPTVVPPTSDFTPTPAAALGIVGQPTVVPPADGTSGQDFTLLITEAQAYQAQGRYAEVAKVYEEILSFQPQYDWVLYEYGQVLLELDRPQDALNAAQQLMAINAGDVRAYILQALANLQLNYPNTALAAATTGYEINPSDSDLLAVLSQVYVRLGNYDEALRYAEAAVRADGTNANAYQAYGWALAALGRRDEAILMFEQAIQYDANRFSLYEDLALQYKVTNQVDEAVKTLEQFLQRQPDNTAAMIGLCETYGQIGDNANAERACEQAVATDPTNAEAYQVLGGVNFRRRNYEAAIKNFEQCLTLGSTAIECYYQRGLASFYLGDCDAAWGALTGASAQNPDQAVFEIIKSGLQLITENCPQYKDVVIVLNTPAPASVEVVIADAGSTFTPTPVPMTGSSDVMAAATATPFPMTIGEGTALPPTLVPPDMAGVAQQGMCQITNPTSDAISLYAAPLTKNSMATVVGEFAPSESAVILYQDYDQASAPFAATWLLIMTNGESSKQATGWVSANSLEPLQMACALTPVPMNSSSDLMAATATTFPMIVGEGTALPPTVVPPDIASAGQQAIEATTTPLPMAGVSVPMPVPSVPTAVPFTNIEGMVRSSGIACDSKDAVIVSPTRKAVVAGKFEITGIATGENFGSYRLELIGLATGGNYVELSNSNQPVASEGTLGALDLGSFPPNNYGLRLVVFDTQNQVLGSCLVNFTLARTADAAEIPTIGLPAGTTSLMPSGFVNVEGAALRDKPNANGQVIATLAQNTAVGIYQSSPDGLWLLVVLGDKTQGWIASSELLGIEPTNLKPAIMCSGVIGDQPAQIYSRPNLSGNAVAIGSIQPQQNVMILDMENQSSNPAAWYYVQSLSNPGLVGWMNGEAFSLLSYCLPPANIPILLPTATAFSLAPPTVVPPTLAVAACTVVNTSDNNVPVYSSPSSSESESLLVNNLAPNTPAQLLFQQTTSDGSNWYLMLALLDGGKQVSGWVDANGVQLVGENCAAFR